MSIAARNAILAGGAALPYDAEVEYLQSTGTQYIDTGIIATNSITINFRIHNPSQAVNSLSPAGIFDNSSGVAIRLSLLANADARYYYYLGSSTNISGMYIPFNQWVRFNLGASMAWQGEVSGSGSYTPPASGAFITSTTVSLFCRHVTNNASRYVDAMWSGKMSDCTISDGGILVRDFIPVRVGSGANAVGYMYDRVSGTLFGNAGTGAFVIGPDASAANGGGV